MTQDSCSLGLTEILPQTLAAARVERRRVLDEKEAFAAFRSRIVKIEPGQSTHQKLTRRGVTNRTQTVGEQGPFTAGLSKVRNVYESTVMAVPHYEKEYNDVYRQSVANELGRELAGALTQGTTFHAKCKRQLLEMVDTVIEVRERFVSHLDVEHASVEHAATKLGSVIEEILTLADESLQTKTFGALEAYRTRIDTLSEQCESIAKRRQNTLNDHDLLLLDDIDIPTYLYQELPVSYPVLATVGKLTHRIESLKGRIDRQIVTF